MAVAPIHSAPAVLPMGHLVLDEQPVPVLAPAVLMADPVPSFLHERASTPAENMVVDPGLFFRAATLIKDNSSEIRVLPPKMPYTKIIEGFIDTMPRYTSERVPSNSYKRRY